MSSQLDYSPLRQLGDHIFLGAIPFDWIVEFVDGDGTLAPAWAAEPAHRYPHPWSVLSLLRKLDEKDGGRRLAVAAAAVFVGEGAARRLPRELINAARRVVSTGATDAAANEFASVADASGYAFNERFKWLKTGVEDGSALPYSYDLYESWWNCALNISGANSFTGAARSRAIHAAGNRVTHAVLAAVPPPHISEVLALVEKP